MKLRDLPKRGRAVKSVPFRLANAPLLPPGQDTDEHTIKVGIRVLRPDEVEDALKEACAAAAAAGVPQWLDTHPLCRLHEMEQVVLRACVDDEARAEPFFVSVEELKSDDGMSADGVAYLYEQWKLWQDENAGPSKNPSLGEVVAMAIEEAGRPENATDGPFSQLRASAQLRSMRTMAGLLASSIGSRSEPSSPAGSSSSDSSPPKKAKPSGSKPPRKQKASSAEGET